MTVPNTPTGPGVEPSPAADPYAVDPQPHLPVRDRRPLLPELRLGVLLTVGGALLGCLVGLLWLWLAPRVMLVATSDAIRYVDPEGEQRAGADSIFALLGLGAGVLTALVAFLLTRARGGGIAVAAGLALGGLAGSLVAWQLGTALGPSADVIGNAKRAGAGVQFSASLELGAHGALLVWPMAAMVVLLGLSAAFGKREQDPPPYWVGEQQWGMPTAPPAGQPAVEQPSSGRDGVERAGVDRDAGDRDGVERAGEDRDAGERDGTTPSA